jgi:hypothetical protein
MLPLRCTTFPYPHKSVAGVVPHTSQRGARGRGGPIWMPASCGETEGRSHGVGQQGRRLDRRIARGSARQRGGHLLEFFAIGSRNHGGDSRGKGEARIIRERGCVRA